MAQTQKSLVADGAGRIKLGEETIPVPKLNHVLVLVAANMIRPGTKPDEQMPDDELTPAWAIDKFVIAGSPQPVTNKMLAFHDEFGPFGTIVMVAHDWDDPVIHWRSMQPMAEQVIPRINEAFG